MQNALIFRERILAPSETFILEQAKPLRRYRPILVGLRRTEPSLQHGFTEILLRSGQSQLDHAVASAFRRFPFGPRFYQQLSDARPALIHAHFAMDGLQGLSIAKKLDLPLIVSLHGFDVTSTPEALRASRSGRHFLAHRKSLFDGTSVFLCVSRFIRDAALKAGFPGSKLLLHYTGIDCERFHPIDIPRDPKLILFVGRLVEKKGCEFLLRAMARVQQADPEARLEIIGDGPLRERLESIASQLSIRVHFRGVQAPEEVLRSMCRARVLCNPSVTAASGDMEGFGMVFAEAQAVGTPVVSFAHAAIPEVVLHRETGLLAQEGNIEELSASIITLLCDSSLWTAMHDRSRQWVEERFDIRRQTEKLESLYDDLIVAHKRRRVERIPSAALGYRADSTTLA